MNSYQRANSNSEVEIIESDNNEIFELIDSDLENIDSNHDIIEIVDDNDLIEIDEESNSDQQPTLEIQPEIQPTSEIQPEIQPTSEIQPEIQPTPEIQAEIQQQSESESNYEQASEREPLPRNVWVLPNLIPSGNMIIDPLPGTSTSVARILQTFSFESIMDITHSNFRHWTPIIRLGSLPLNFDSINDKVMVNAKNRIALDLLRDKIIQGLFDVTKLIRIFRRALQTNALFALVEMLTFRSIPLTHSRTRVLFLRDGRYLIKSRGALIFSPLVKLLQLNVTVRLPERSMSRRIFIVDFVEYTSFNDIIEAIEDELGLENVVGIFFLEFLFIFDKTYDHLLYTYRLSGYYAQLFMPRYAFKLRGLHNIIYQLKCCRRLNYN
jgi:hypothetical protein